MYVIMEKMQRSDIMSALFFITTVVFLLLYLRSRSENSNLKNEILRLRSELLEKNKTEEQQSSENDVKGLSFSASTPEPQASSSPYNMSYKNRYSHEPSAAPKVSEKANTSTEWENTVPTVSINAEPQKRTVSSINVLLIIGSLLIILAGIIFATTTWAILGNVVKTVIILSFSAVLFGVSSIAERKLDLPRTGKVFYILGCAFLPITVLAIGYFKIFGEWFALGGEGSCLVLATASFLTAVVCFKGSYDYSDKRFALCSLMCASVTAAFIANQITEEPDLIMLCYAVYSLIVILISRLVQRLTVKLDAFAQIIDILPKFELLNTALFSFAAFVVPSAWLGHSAAVTVSCGLFAAAYIFSGFSEKNGFAGAVPFLLFVSLASFYGISPESFSEGTYVIAVIATVVSVLSMLRILPEKFVYALKILSSICIGISAAAFGIAAISSEITTASVIVSAILAAEILVLGIIRRNETAGKVLFIIFSFALSVTVVSAAELITLTDSAFAIVSTGILLAAALGYAAADIILGRKGRSFILRSVFSDVMFTAFAAIIVISRLDGDALGITELLCAALIMFSFAIFPKMEWERFAFSLTAVLTLGVLPSVNAFEELMSENALFTVISTVLAAITVVIMLVKKERLTGNGALTGLISVNLIYILISSFSFSSRDPIWQFWLILAIVIAVKAFLDHRKVTPSAAIVLACLTFAAAAYDIFDMDYCAQFVAAGGFVSVLFAALLFVPNNELVTYCKKFSFICLDFISFVLLCILSFTGTVSAGVNIGTAIVLAMTVTSGYMTLGSALLTPTLAALYFAAANQLLYAFESDENASIIACSVIAAMIILSVGASYLLHRNKFFEKKCKGFDFDGFAAARFAGVVAYCSVAQTDIQSWLGLWLLCVSVISLLRKESSPLVKKIVISAAMLVPVIAWWTQPFFELPDNYALEVNIVPILVYLAALRLLKWDKKAIDGLTFITYIIVYVILFFNALDGTIGNALIVMISAFVILALSFFIKVKRWFVLGAVVITTSAIFMSIKQWGSPAWWVYLLAAGIILIAVGALNEMKKKSSENGLSEKISRFMSEWIW